MLDLALRRVEVGSWTLGYRRTGNGPPVVLLHGGLSESREWLPVMERAAGFADLVALDVPGCGASSDPPDDSSMADLAETVAAFVEAIDLAQPHLCGLSFGAGLALQVAISHPSLPRSLVMLSGYAGWAGSLPPDEVAARLDWARALVGGPPGTRPETRPDPSDLVPGLLGSSLAPDLAELLADVSSGFRPAPTRVLLEAFAAADLRDDLPAVRCPTVVVHGERDARAPRPVADALHRGIPGSRLVVVPGVGHQLNLEAPDAVTAVLREMVGTGERLPG